MTKTQKLTQELIQKIEAGTHQTDWNNNVFQKNSSGQWVGCAGYPKDAAYHAGMHFYFLDGANQFELSK